MSETFRHEMRHAARALARSPVFTIIAVATLGLGIGATTAIFTLLDRVVLRPLPYPDASRIVNVQSAVSGKTASGTWGVSVAGYFEYRRHNHSFEDLGAYGVWQPTIADENGPERVSGAMITASVVRVLGLHAARGRLFTADEDHPGGPNVVVLSNDLWRRRFGADPGIVGKTLTVEGTPHTIIGVMDPGVELPADRVEIWLPLPIDSLAPAVNDHSLSAVGKLKPGVQPADAQRDLAALTQRFPSLFPSAYSEAFIREYHFTPVVTPARDLVLGNIGHVLWVLLGSVAIVLLIACANVANLHLVRFELRQRELAVRRALGASGWRLAWHFLSESILLALAAGALGVALAWSGIRFLLTLAPSGIPRLDEVQLDGATIGFAIAISVGIALVFGLAPSLRRRQDFAALREGARGSTASRGQLSTRDVLLVSQVALAFVLLAAATLLVQSFRNLRNVRPGFDPDGVLGFTVALPRSTYHDYATVEQFYRQLIDRLHGLPGVTNVGATQSLPLADYSGTACALAFAQDKPLASGEQAPCFDKIMAAPTYFAAMHIPVRGDVPSWSDVENHAAGVVVSEALARHFWPGEDAIGKSIGNTPKSPFYRVSGVAADVHSAGLDKPAPEIIYYPLIPLAGTFLWSPPNEMAVVVRTTASDPAALTSSIRRAVSELDRSVPIANVEPLTAVVERSMARVSFAALLLGLAAAMALLLSAIGVFGAIAYVVSQRRREIGVRIALGAEPRSVSAQIVLQAMRLGVIGLVIGVAGMLGTGSILRSILVGVGPTDPRWLALAAIVVLAVVALASYLPAYRASRVSPVEALRAD